MFRRSFSENKIPQLNKWNQDQTLDSIIPGSSSKGEIYVPPTLITVNYDLSPPLPMNRQVSGGSTASLSSNPSLNTLQLRTAVLKSKTVELKTLLDSNDNHLVVVIKNYLDGSNLLKYMAKQPWSGIDYILRIDISMLLSWNPLPEASSLANFIYRFSPDRTFDERELSSILSNNPTNVLFLVEGFNKISNSMTIPSVQNILEQLSHQNNIIITTYRSTLAEAQQSFPTFNLIEDYGFTPQNIDNYLANNYKDGPIAQKIAELLKKNTAIYDICAKSPSMLQAVGYILEKNQDASSDSITLTNIYIEILYLLSQKHAQKHLHVNIVNVFNMPIVKFMQELAFETLRHNNIITAETLEQLLTKYKQDIIHGLDPSTDPMSLIEDFGLIRVNKVSGSSSSSFIHKDLIYFFAALYFRNELFSRDEQNVQIINSIITNEFDTTYLPSMKFVAGLISFEKELTVKNRVMNNFIDAVSINSQEVLRWNGNKYITTIIGMLSQNIIDGKLDPSVPLSIIEMIDRIVINDFDKWKTQLVKNQYYSNAIIDWLLDKLKNGNNHEILQAVKTLPLLNIRDLYLKNEIAKSIIKTSDSSNYEIAEASIYSLECLASCDGVKDFLINKLKESKSEDIVIVTAEVLGNIGDLYAADHLIHRLKTSNSWMALSILTSLNKLRYDKETKSKVINSLIDMLALKEQLNDDIYEKIEKTLYYFNVETKSIINSIISNKINDSDKNVVLRSITILKNLLNDPSFLDIDNSFTNNVMSKVMTTIKSRHFTFKNDPEIIVELTKTIASIFLKADSSTKKLAYYWFKDHVQGNIIPIKVISIEALSKLYTFGYNIDEISDILVKKMTNSRFIEAKIAAIQAVGEINLSPYKLKSAISQLTKEIEKSTDSTYIIACLTFFGKTTIANNPRDELLLKILEGTSPILEYPLVENAAIKMIELHFAIFTPSNQLLAIDFILQRIVHIDNQDSLISSLTALENLYNIITNSDKKDKITQSISQEAILLSRFDAVQINALNIISRIDKSHSIILKIINRLDNSLSSEVKIAALDALSMTTGEVLKNQDIFIYDAINKAFLDYDKTVHQAAARILFKCYPQSINDAIDKLKSKIISSSSTESKKYSAIDSIGIILELVPIDYLDATDIVQLLYSQKDRLRSISLHSLSKIMKHIPFDKQSVIKKDLAEELEMKVLLHESEIGSREDPFDRISHHYTENDLKIIVRFFDILVFKALRSKNAFIQMKIFDLVDKTSNMDHIFIDILNERLSQIDDITQQIALLKLIKAKFSSNLNLNTLLVEKSDELLLKQKNSLFFNIEDILDNLDGFKEHVDNNNIDVKFTRCSLVVGDVVILLTPNDDLEVNINIIQKIYFKISGKSLSSRETPHLFSGVTNTNMIGNAVQLSIFHKKTTEDSYVDTYIVTSKASIFGLIVNKYYINQERVVVETCISTDNNYLTDLFGDPNMSVEYTIRNSIVTLGAHDEIIKEIKSATAKKELFIIAQEALDLDPEVEQSKFKVSHNELIRHNIEAWRAKIENALDEVEYGLYLLNNKMNRFEAEIKDLQINQEDTNKIINALKAFHNVKPTATLTDYQNAIFIKITQKLIEYYLASLVTLTPMVANSQQGELSTAAVILQKIGSFFPVISLGTDTFCSFILTLNKETQRIISQHIADIALTPEDMTKIAKEIALIISTSTINLESFEPQTFYQKYQAIILSAKGFKSEVLTKLVTSLQLVNDVNSGENLESKLGTKHGTLVVTLLISYIIANDFHPGLDPSINSNKLIDFLTTGNYITIDAADTTPLMIDVNPDVLLDDAEPKTPPINLMYKKKTQLIAEKIFEKAKDKLFPQATNNEASIQDLMNHLAWENCNPEQTLVRLSSLNGNLGAMIINSLTKQLVKKGSFIIQGDEIILKASDIFPSIQGTKDELSKFSFINYNGEKIDIEPGNHDNIFKLELDLEASGYALMKIAEIAPAITYLMHNYVPGGKWIMNSDFIKSLPSYDYQTAVVHVAGAGISAWANPSQKIPLVISTLIHASKIHIYKFTNEQLMLLHYSDEDGWMKFMKFVATDSFVSIAIALPLMPVVTPLAVGLAFTQGSLTGSISYFNQKTKHEEPSEAGYIFSLTTTSFTLVGVGMIANNRETNIDKVFTFASGIPIAANIHYLSKFIGDFTSETLNEFIGSNATATYNNDSLTGDL